MDNSRDAAASALESLPAELLGSITLMLRRNDFRNLRLVSPIIAQVTSPFLAMEHFDGREAWDVATRLAELSRVPGCATRITSLTLNCSTWADYHHRIVRSNVKNSSRSHSSAADTALKMGNAEKFSPASMADALRRLQNIRHLHLIWGSQPGGLEHDELQKRRTRILEMQRVVLTTLWQEGIVPTSLRLDPFVPLQEILAVPPSLQDEENRMTSTEDHTQETDATDVSPLHLGIELGWRSLSSLRHLHLCWTTDDPPGQRLEEMLSKTPNLVHLHLDASPGR